MSHSDPDDLALRALGEDVGGDLDAHLSACADCRAELDRLREVVAVGRAVRPEDAPQDPPPSVWDGIVTELGLDAAPRAMDDLALRRSSPRRRFTALVAAAAAVVGIGVGVAGSALLGGSDDEPAGTVVATAALAALPDRSGTGRATLETVDGERVLVLDVSGLSRGDGVYEVWLLDTGATRLVSLGLLDGARGRFTLPRSVDVGAYPVVDVSIEPVDGDPAHSGDSVVRGTLSS